MSFYVRAIRNAALDGVFGRAFFAERGIERVDESVYNFVLSAAGEKCFPGKSGNGRLI